MAKKKRADLILYEQGLAESREMAARLIMSGRVFLLPPDKAPLGCLPPQAGPAASVRPEGLKRVDKPGDLLPPEASLTLKEKNPFVSRGPTSF